MWEYGLIFGLFIAIGYWVLHPLFRPEPLPIFSSVNTDRGDREGALHQRKEDVYAAIKEIDFDYGMGKISDGDYQELTSQYKTKALEILKELETLEGGDDIGGVIEREVQRLRGKKGSREDGKGEARSVGQSHSCPQCGEKVALTDNFCRLCGMTLN